MTIAEFTTKLIGDKRRWRAYKARTRQLPASYRTAVKGLERYLLRFGPTDADTSASMFEELVGRFEEAVAAEIPVREIVGENPVEFVKGLVQSDSTINGMSAQERERLISEFVEKNPAVLEAFLQTYADGGWAGRERKRLVSTIDRAEGSR